MADNFVLTKKHLFMGAAPLAGFLLFVFMVALISTGDAGDITKGRKIGDVIINGGSPGHGVVVIDMVKDSTGAKKKFLLAQSYMPAQELQILKNGTSDWFEIPTSETFNTPEWRFEVKGPKRF